MRREFDNLIINNNFWIEFLKGKTTSIFVYIINETFY